MKILITGALNYDENFKKLLVDMGYEIEYLQNELQDVKKKYVDIEGIICNNFFLHNDIEEYKKLKFIQLTSAGLDRIPMEYIKKKGIKLYRAENVYSIPIAEWVIMRLLEVYKNLNFFIENQKNKKWEKNRELDELTGKEIAILGCGNIGEEIAKKLKAFDCRIIGADIREINNKNFDEIKSIKELKSILKDKDIVILALPLTEKTKHLINRESISWMKKNTILVNVARGSLIKEEHLIEKLKENYFKAVILDVFEEEPLEEKRELWTEKKVLLSPHNSFISLKNGERLKMIIENNLKSII